MSFGEMEMTTMLLFDHDYLVQAYGRRQKIEGVVNVCQDVGFSIEETICRIAEKFGLTENVSSGYVHEFWRSENANDETEEEWTS